MKCGEYGAESPECEPFLKAVTADLSCSITPLTDCNHQPK